ncbi:MAG: insulinase family protein, partial [Actinomycetota bacterium]|nr:insulinase family protein [Actinomycetota bacterium]
MSHGARTLAVRRPGVPLVEVRLRIPFAAPSGKRGAAHAAQAQLLADSMLLGTASRDASRLAQDLQSLGGQLSVSADADRLGMSGSVLAGQLPAFLELLGELLTSAAYPRDEVAGERDRLVQELAIYRSQPSAIAREALLARMYRSHPYGRDLPSADDIALVRPKQLRALHAARVGPRQAVLTLVGDLS